MDQADPEADNEWDAYAADWDGDEGARAYAAAAFDSLRTVLADRSITLDGTLVLDFGCGTGLLTERLLSEGAIVTAVDRRRRSCRRLGRHGI